MKNNIQIVLVLLSLTHFGVAYAELNEKQVIVTKKAPNAVGPYSQAVKIGDALYLSGQIAIDPTTAKMIHGTIKQQTKQVLENIKAVLNAAGYKLSNVVQSQVYLTNLNNYKSMNTVYAEYFIDKPPARAVVEASGLPLNALIEIMVVAVK